MNYTSSNLHSTHHPNPEFYTQSLQPTRNTVSDWFWASLGRSLPISVLSSPVISSIAVNCPNSFLHCVLCVPFPVETTTNEVLCVGGGDCIFFPFVALTDSTIRFTGCLPNFFRLPMHMYMYVNSSSLCCPLIQLSNFHLGLTGFFFLFSI